MSQTPHRFEHGPGAHDRISYLLHVPPEAPDDDSPGHPLVLYLHGSGERGSDLDLVRQQGLARLVEERADFPMVVASPQCPAGAAWYRFPRTLLALLDQLLAREDVDPARVYLTGNSMGGYGTWGLAARHPSRFAAIAPICGGGLRTDGFPARLAALKRVPVWAFHGALDQQVEPAESQRLVEGLREAGGEVRYTLYPDLGHDSWTRAYADPALYAWLLTHELRAGRDG